MELTSKHGELIAKADIFIPEISQLYRKYTKYFNIICSFYLVLCFYAVKKSGKYKSWGKVLQTSDAGERGGKGEGNCPSS